MKPGDVVMFVSEGTYKESFYGKIGEVVRSSVNKHGDEYVNVLWNTPVKYFNSYTKNSSFNVNKFILMVDGDAR